MKSDEKIKFVGFPFSTSRQNDHPHPPSAHSTLIIALRSYVNLGWIYGASLWDKDNCLMLEVVSFRGKARVIGPLRKGGGVGGSSVFGSEGGGRGFWRFLRSYLFSMSMVRHLRSLGEFVSCMYVWEQCVWV